MDISYFDTRDRAAEGIEWTLKYSNKIQRIDSITWYSLRARNSFILTLEIAKAHVPLEFPLSPIGIMSLRTTFDLRFNTDLRILLNKLEYGIGPCFQPIFALILRRRIISLTALLETTVTA